MTLKYEWIDGRHRAKGKPNPDYPDGIDLDASGGAVRSCRTDLPHPTKRCGKYLVTCDVCKLLSVITTAGRADDPRSVKVACKPLSSLN